MILVTIKLKVEVFLLIILSIKNGGYAFLIRLDIIFSMSLWKESQLLKISIDLSIKHLLKQMLYENVLQMFLEIKIRPV